MVNLFRRLPFPLKLTLIGLIPSLFLLYLSVLYYNSERQKLDLLQDDIRVINRSTMVDRLMDEMQEERRFAYEFALKKDQHNQLAAQCKRTDAVISYLQRDPELKNFDKYTMLDELAGIRARNNAQQLGTNQVMDYYTTTIFRLSMLEIIPKLQLANGGDVNQDLHGARALSQLITYLGILRSNLYNVMFTRQYQYGNGYLQGLLGVYKVYSTYQAEFSEKSSPASVAAFRRLSQYGALKKVNRYLDNSFHTMQFDSTSYNDVQWWKTSGSAVEQLRGLQNNIWNHISIHLNKISRAEHTKLTRLSAMLVLTLGLCVGIITLTIASITRTVRELRKAAGRIAAGQTGLKLNIISDDVMGRLARSVSQIDETNKKLAEAAEEIGRGNFDFPIKPRGSSDILGNAVLNMKNELQRFKQTQLEQATELRRLLAAVLESENHFRQIADQAPLMIWELNTDGKVTYVNKQWTDFTGLSFEESLGDGWIQVVHPDDLAAAGSFEEAFGKRVPYRSKTRFRNIKDEYRWTLVNADPVYKNGLFNGYLGSLTDITDQVNAQQAIMDLMNKKDEFLNIASHELKTPLTSIKSYTQLLKKYLTGGEKQIMLVSKSLLHVEKLEKLVNDLLDVSRINSGQMVYHDEIFDFAEILQQTVEHFEDVSNGKHRIIVEGSAHAMIRADRSRIEQVLNNLILNAEKYSPEADRIQIRVNAEGGQLCVAVSDFGVGIDAEDIDMLFNKFYRTKKNFYKFQGLGLGLFISHEIVTRHKGRIWAKSEIGRGSTFYFQLPLHPLVPAPATIPAEKTVTSN